MKEALDALVGEMVDKGILFDEARLEFERRFIKRVLDRAAGNQSCAAKALGMHRNTLSRKLAELRLNGNANGNGAKPPAAMKTRVKPPRRRGS